MTGNLDSHHSHEIMQLLQALNRDGITIVNVACIVMGALTAKGSGGFGHDPDDLVLMPRRTLWTGSSRLMRLTSFG